MAFTEFYCNSATGSNLNSGDAASGAVLTYANGTFVRSTGVFTLTGAIDTESVTVGRFVSIYTNGATVPGIVGRITTVTADSITISLTACSGAAANVSESANGSTCKYGGPWAGPSGTVAFPFGFAAAAMKNEVGSIPRINFKGTFTMGSSWAHNLAGPIVFQGYKTAAGDITDAADFPVFDNSAGAYSINLSTVTGFWFQHLKHYSSVLTTSRHAYQGNYQTTSVVWYQCLFEGGTGLGNMYSGSCIVIECEFYNCNGYYGTRIQAPIVIRCVVHGTANTFSTTAITANVAIGCVVSGITCSSAAINAYLILNCDVYNITTGSGYLVSATGGSSVINCNAVGCGGYGFTFGSSVFGMLVNCGSENNASGRSATLPSGWMDLNPVAYSNSNKGPWNDPANGDFTITNADSIGHGAGGYLLEDFSGVVIASYPVIGACEPQRTAGGGIFMTRPIQLGM